MATGKLRIPGRLAAVVLSTTLVGCPPTGSGDAVVADGGMLCPDNWFCSSDAARAVNCQDGVDGRFQTMSDAGTCFAPI